MSTQEAQEIAKKIFANHDINEVFVTSDGQVFTTEKMASIHASRTLKNSLVIPVNKADLVQAAADAAAAANDSKTQQDGKVVNIPKIPAPNQVDTGKTANTAATNPAPGATGEGKTPTPDTTNQETTKTGTDSNVANTGASAGTDKNTGK